MERLDLTIFLTGKEGTKLYSPICGECTLVAIVEDTKTYPILVRSTHNNLYKFTPFGQCINTEDSECLLFPSKDERNWDKFRKRGHRGEEYYTIIVNAGEIYLGSYSDVRSTIDNLCDAKKYLNQIKELFNNNKV